MRIDVAIVDAVPLGVDTPEDLAKAREILAREVSREAPSRETMSGKQPAGKVLTGGRNLA